MPLDSQGGAGFRGPRLAQPWRAFSYPIFRTLKFRLPLVCLEAGLSDALGPSRPSILLGAPNSNLRALCLLHLNLLSQDGRARAGHDAAPHGRRRGDEPSIGRSSNG
jgi:hypothetical protein